MATTLTEEPTMSTPFPHLFQPVQLGPKQARNRVMRLATTSGMGEHSQVSDRMVAFYRRVAAGGVGTIVSEAVPVHASSLRSDTGIALFRPETVPGMRRLADAVHEQGALLVAQLNHGGRQHHAQRVPNVLWGVSAIACPHSGGVPHEMTEKEIGSLIEGFVRSAVHAREGGLDGVEIHGAQGHLVQQFVSPFSNQRTDDFGGSFEKRLHFPREVIRRIREAVGKDCIVGYRMGVDEFTPGGITLEDSQAFARVLVADGLVDYLSLSQSNFNSIEMHLPDRHFPLGTFVDLHAQVKAEAGTLPTVTCTRIQTPEQAEEILRLGKADLIGLCRALIVDPDWPAKALAGHPEDIRLCIACNECWGGGMRGGSLTCCCNPEAGRELDFGPLAASAAPRRVVVAGGGPAGLEAARVAAQRGHQVTLFEGRAALGGKIRGAAFVPGHEEMGHVLQFLVPQVEKLGVTVRTQTEATAQTIAAERPDAVIVATGATPVAPALPGDGSVPVVASTNALPGLPGERVVVMDEEGSYRTSSFIELLAQQGKQVTLVTRFFEALRELPPVSRIATLRALDQLGVQLRPNMFVDRTEGGGVVLKNHYSGREESIPAVSAVLWIGPQRANDALVEELRAFGIEAVQLIGDAFAPRRLSNAIQEGHRAGRLV